MSSASLVAMIQTVWNQNLDFFSPIWPGYSGLYGSQYIYSLVILLRFYSSKTANYPAEGFELSLLLCILANQYVCLNPQL